MITVAQLGRLKRIFDELNVADIPVGDDPKQLANAFVLGSCTDNKVFDEFFEVVTGEKGEWHTKDFSEVIGVATDFFTNMDSQLKELITTMLDDKKIQLRREVESTRAMMREAMTKAFQNRETTTSILQPDSKKTE